MIRFFVPIVKHKVIAAFAALAVSPFGAEYTIRVAETGSLIPYEQAEYVKTRDEMYDTLMGVAAVHNHGDFTDDAENDMNSRLGYYFLAPSIEQIQRAIDSYDTESTQKAINVYNKDGF